MSHNRVAYFSMEIGIAARMPTYSGGLGVLAGDSLKSAADLGQPVIGVTLLHRKGYFRQAVDPLGRQSESPLLWPIEEYLELLPQSVSITIERRPVEIRAWRYQLKGVRGHVVPVLFLDTAVATNDPWHQTLTDTLYGGDERYRICQEMVLGVGGVRMLEALGYAPAFTGKGSAPGTGASRAGVTTYHMNEGHAAFLTMALLETAVGGGNLVQFTTADADKVRALGVFTTHTPVPAGHDSFPRELALSVLGEQRLAALEKAGAIHGGRLNMSHLALRFSRYVNGVAKRHGEVSRAMFPGEKIAAITNGVHAGTWTAAPLATLFDQHVPGWRENNFLLRHACEIPLSALCDARHAAKRALNDVIRARSGQEFRDDVFTIGFARRSAEYKRGDLLFRDASRLVAMAEKFGGLQIVFAGKAHPRDAGGKRIIERVVAAAQSAKSASLKFVFLENYDMDLGHVIASGVDVWLNNPLKPLEASGTSGMKAALNGIPSLSTLDGWWVEGCIDGVTGWEIMDPAMARPELGQNEATDAELAAAAENIYARLERDILPLFKSSWKTRWAEIMRNCIAINGSWFNTQRQMLEYADQAWGLKAQAE